MHSRLGCRAVFDRVTLNQDSVFGTYKSKPNLSFARETTYMCRCRVPDIKLRVCLVSYAVLSPVIVFSTHRLLGVRCGCAVVLALFAVASLCMRSVSGDGN